MSQRPSRVSADGERSWENAVRRAEPGDTEKVPATNLAPHVVVPGLDGSIVTARASALAPGDRQFPRGSLDEHLGRSSVAHLPRRLVAVGDGVNCVALRAAS